jgi:penicillin G amidase
MEPVEYRRRPYYPKKARTIWFLRQLRADPDKWKDWLKPYSTIEELITTSFKGSVAELNQKYGSEPAKWEWSTVQPTYLPHVARIPGLGSDLLTMDGTGYSIMSNKGIHGPAWKLVAEMGPRPRAWSQFPGGVTGNPLDPEYEKFIESWSKGEMRAVKFWLDSQEALANAAYVWQWERR